MTNINKFKEIINEPTITFVLLTLLTCLFYPLMWAWRYMDKFNAEFQEEVINKNFILAIAILLGLSMILIIVTLPPIGSRLDSYTINSLHTRSTISSLLLLSGLTCEIILAFQIKRALESYVIKTHKFILNLNTVWTLFFNFAYINYSMNNLDYHMKRAEMIADLQNQKNM